MRAKGLYIRHVLLTTGEERDSSTRDAALDAISSSAGIVEKIANGKADPAVAIPGRDGYSVSGSTGGRCLLASVWANGPRPELVASFGVAGHSTCGAATWRTLHQIAEVSVATDPERQPPVPWWSGLLFAPGIRLYPEAFPWLWSFHLHLSWAWLLSAPSDQLHLCTLQ